MKHTFTAAACSATLVASLAACGGSEKAAISNTTASSSPSTTATSQPTMPPPTTTTNAGPAILAAHSTYIYGGLTVVVNLPANIPTASQPNMRLFSEFLQADARTTALSRLDPSLVSLASTDVVKDTKDSITAGSVQGIGSVTYTVNKLHSLTGGITLITGCLDQSKIVHLRKDGSRFVDANATNHPTLKMTANINRVRRRPEVTLFTFVDGTC